jgi:hypothetical protein
MDREPRNVNGDPEPVGVARPAPEPPLQPDIPFLFIDFF